MSGRDFDTNAFTAQFLLQSSELLVSKVTDSGAVARIRRVLQHLTDAYAPFLEKTYRRVSTIRTFLKQNESVDLLETYVPVDLNDKSNEREVSSLIDDLHQGESFVISALAGRGKSVLMRYIALSLYISPRGKIPLFLELRSLNSLTTKNILPFIHSQYKGEKDVSYDDFLFAVKSGYFCLLLDGFDEISPTDRDDIESQLLDIFDNFPKCPVVISGRADPRYKTWERATTLYLNPMNLRQTRELIDRASYDEEVKKTFLKRLNKDFFDKHESFLNTPLLAIMLMLTFEDYAEIPHSIHEFYRNAFDMLLRRHDAMKSQFLRKTHSGCTAEELKKIFSSFCIITYSDNAYSFNREDALGYISASIKQQGVKVSPVKVLDDFIESICLLHEEGFEISFVHRSFQEYFTAYFMAMAPVGLISQFLDSPTVRWSDDVIPMLYGMNSERVEDEWARDFVAALLSKYPPNDPLTPTRLFLASCSKFTFNVFKHSAVLVYEEQGQLYDSIRVLERMYPKEFSGSGGALAIDGRQWCLDLLRAGAELERAGNDEFEGFESALEAYAKRRDDCSFDAKLNLDENADAFIRALLGNGHEDELNALVQIRKRHRANERSENAFIKKLFE